MKYKYTIVVNGELPGWLTNSEVSATARLTYLLANSGGCNLKETELSDGSFRFDLTTGIYRECTCAEVQIANGKHAIACPVRFK